MALGQMQTVSIISQCTVSSKGTPADQPKLGSSVAGALTSTVTWLSLCTEMHMPMQHGML